MRPALVTIGVFLGLSLVPVALGQPARPLAGPGPDLPNVATGAEANARLGQRVQVCGLLRTFDRTGPGKPGPATRLVLPDNSQVIVTYGAPPVQWDRFVDQRICVRARLVGSSPLHPQSVGGPHLSEWDFPVLQPAKEGSMAPVDLSKQLGRRVSLQGLARDAKGGAVLLVDGNEPVYIEGLDSWPDEIHGARLTASGVLRLLQYLPEARVDAKGAISQGAVGKQYVLVEASWIRSGAP